MTPFEAFELYTALKLHFSKPDYDFIKFNGKTRLNAKSFEARPDRVFFQKLAKHQDAKGFLLANFVSNPKIWIRDLAYSNEAEYVYKEWTKRQQSLLYLFKEDLKKLNDGFDSNILCSNGQHPKLLMLYSANVISLETLCILVSLVACSSYWESRLPYDPIVEHTLFVVKKYTPFLNFDRAKATMMVQERFRSENDAAGIL